MLASSSSHNASESHTPSDRQCDYKKIIYDPIHKLIKLHPVWVKIIDTPEFQRLRYIKQLGCSFFVYPSATHTRFEHSIGVCFLAWRMAKTLQKQLGEEYVTNEDVLCVSIAGLCHDLGHGPFSHTWERFMERVKDNGKWKHENMSVEIFERIWKHLENEPEWKEYKLNKTHLIFIGDLIRGVNSQKPPSDNLDYKDKDFLFEIVANKKNGVDVDKWDYLTRDAYYVGTNTSFDHERLLHFARALGPDGKKSIHYRNSEILNFYHMFDTRVLLHQRIYQHRVVRMIDMMMIDALEAAYEDEDLFNKKKKLNEYVNNIDDYLKLNDSIFHLMLELPEDHKARKLIERIQERDLYRCVGCAVTDQIGDISVKKIKRQVREISSLLRKKDFCIDVIHFNYRKNQEDPVKKIPIYDKDGKVVESEDCIPSLMLTKTFAEKKILFVSYESDDTTQGKVKNAFEKWFKTYKGKLGLRKSC